MAESLVPFTVEMKDIGGRTVVVLTEVGTITGNHMQQAADEVIKKFEEQGLPTYLLVDVKGVDTFENLSRMLDPSKRLVRHSCYAGAAVVIPPSQRLAGMLVNLATQLLRANIKMCNSLQDAEIYLRQMMGIKRE